MDKKGFAISSKQPKALPYLSVCYALFMWAFCSLVASLTLYLTTLSGMDEKQAYVLYAIYAGLLWILPVIGGYAAERFGYFESSVIGLLICFAGILLLCFQKTTLIYFALSLFLIGNSLFTPALWCIVDHLYQKEDIKREAGFTLFYLTFNVGAVLGIFTSSYLGAHFSYTLEFFCSACVLLLSLATLFFSKNQLVIAKGRSIAAQLSASTSTLFTQLTAGCIILSPCIASLFFYPEINTVLIYIIAISTLVYMLKLAKEQPTKVQQNKTYGFVVLCLFALGFWTLYNLEPSLLSLFILHSVNTNLFGLHISADAFFGFEGLFIIIVGMGLTRLWLYLAMHNHDLSLAIKFGMALLFIGAGFLFLNFVVRHNGLNQKVPALYIVMSYLFFATGELFIGPLGISMVGKLSPKGKEGLLMGVWQLVVGVGAIVSGWLAKLSVSPAHSSFVASQTRYTHLFMQLGLVIVAGGVIVLLLSPKVKRLLGDA